MRSPGREIPAEHWLNPREDNMSKFIKTSGVALAASMAVTGAVSGAAQADEVRLSYVAASMIWPAVVAMADGFEARAKELGATPVILDAQGSAEGEANAIDDLIAQGVDGISILPLDSVAAEVWAEKTHEAGLPFVAVAAQVGDPYNRSWNDVYPGVSALVGKDDVVAGENAAKLALSLLPQGDTAKIAILEGAPGFVAAVQRSQGFIKGLDGAGIDYEVVSSQPTDWTPEKGEAVCQNILVANPDVDLFFSHADDMALGCARAIAANGSEAKLIATAGGSTLGLNAIQAGELDGTVCMPWETVGRMAADALYEAVTNADTPEGRVIDVDTPIVTADTLDLCPPQW